jgi:uncharacterized membrane protein YjjP (DUF1212 family)
MPLKPAKISPSHSRNSSVNNLLRHTSEIEVGSPFSDPKTSPVLKPRPSVLRNNSPETFSRTLDGINELDEKAFSALAAQERAQRIASLVGSHSAPASRRNSVDDDDDAKTGQGREIRLDDIPLVNLHKKRTYGNIPFEESDEDDMPFVEKPKVSSSSEAHKLVRAHTSKQHSDGLRMPSEPEPGLVSGQVTPIEDFPEDYVPRPREYRGGVLSSLLKLYNANESPTSRRGSEDTTGSPSIASSGATTPRSKQTKWYNARNQSQETLSNLVQASNILGAPGGVRTAKKAGPAKPGMGKRAHSGRLLDSAMSRMRPRLEDEIRITVHIAETLSRQKYLLKLCRALMSYGAPTHRLEEYMKMSARVLEIDGQFLYIPGCMIISFDDASTHTTEVKLVKTAQGVNLGKLKDVHDIYKEVVHDVIGVEEATQRLDGIIHAKQKHNKWLLVIVYGFASASVAPFGKLSSIKFFSILLTPTAFEGRFIDLPIAFFLGCVLGFLQLIVAPRSDLYSNVFEISAAVFTSFLARAFGSIRGGNIFCFSALAQSSIALILPGYLVLCASLELQSRSMVAGSVRMVYAIIYSLFLGYGITIGTALYGLMDSNATSATSCTNPIDGYRKWIFVPIFTLCLIIINQAKWKQTPVMLIISFVGYIVNYFSARKFPSAPQISNTLGAFSVGVLGNLYSRMRHGLAAAALLPAIFVQVPSGLAASGSLLAGLSSADQITNSTTYANGTAKINGTSSVSILMNSVDQHPYTLPFLVCFSPRWELSFVARSLGFISPIYNVYDCHLYLGI